jgi:CheY-like chemotaxis protein
MIQSGELTPGYYARLSVRDSGRGIDPVDMERVFDPFFTTKQGGTGLGLSIVHGIAIGYGGGIDIESRLGSGTTVTVYLPAHAGTPPAYSEVSDKSREQRSPEGNRTIVFVDDEEHVLSTGAAIIESLGYTVKAFRSAESAVAFVREHRGAVSLVFADYIMPNQSGIDLAKALRLIDPALPVVLCTGYSAGVDVTEREAAGIREVLKKPVFREDFESALRRQLG